MPWLLSRKKALLYLAIRPRQTEPQALLALLAGPVSLVRLVVRLGLLVTPVPRVLPVLRPDLLVLRVKQVQVRLVLLELLA
jgi:hypothetical protein